MILLDVTVADEAGTRRLAEDFAMVLRSGDVIALSGDLGAGKSAFARAAIRALAGDDRLEVPSPTFTLVQAYELPGLTVSHFDLYRLADPGELREIGLDEAARGGVLLVEWPERAGDSLPRSTLTVSIEETADAEGRRFVLSGEADAWADRLARTGRIRELLDAGSAKRSVRRRLAGDVSSRRYERVSRDGERLVVMDWPRRGPQPPLRDGLSYPELVHVQDNPLSFLAVDRMLRKAGFLAPAIHAVDRRMGLIVMDDLGPAMLHRDGKPVPERFITAAEVLAEKDATRFPARVTVPGEGTWTLPRFDARALATELSLLPDWYLPMIRGGATDPALRAEFFEMWEPLVAKIGALPTGLVLRDVIAPNLVWIEGATGRGRIGFLDFQDAMIGPAAYDLMSLTTDVRLDIPDAVASAMVDAYVAARSAADRRFDAAGLGPALALLSAQRNSKILGGFARTAIRDGKPGYLAYLPTVKRRVAAALADPVLTPLRLWYERHHILD